VQCLRHEKPQLQPDVLEPNRKSKKGILGFNRCRHQKPCVGRQDSKRIREAWCLSVRIDGSLLRRVISLGA
jgi:hypothetical protein